jgi:transcriptional regulator with XRE-family HTH domain
MVGREGKMLIGDRLRALREQKKLSQGDIELRTGLLRCYISRVENGHTVPAVETLEKLARALEMPLYEFLYDGVEPPVLRRNGTGVQQWGASGPRSRYLARLCQSLARMQPDDRDLLLYMTQRMASRKRRSK